MVGIPRFLQQTVVCLGLLLLVQVGATAAWADQCYSCGRLSGCECTPNAANFGYFPPQWRVWPGEARPDKDFPHSIGAEVIRTPRRAPLQERPQPDASGPFIDEPVPEEGAGGALPPGLPPTAEAPPVAVDPAAQFGPPAGPMGVDEPMPMAPEAALPPVEQPAEGDLPPMPVRPAPLEPMPTDSSQSSLDIGLPGLSAASRPNVPFPPRPDSSLLTRPSGRLPLGADTPSLARPNMSGPARVDVLPAADPYRGAGFSEPVAPTAPPGIAANLPPASMPFEMEAPRAWHGSPPSGEPPASDPAGHSWAGGPFAPGPPQPSQALSGLTLEGGGLPSEGGFDMALPQPWSQPRDWRQDNQAAAGVANANQQAIYHDPPPPAAESEFTLPTGPGVGFPPQPAQQAAYQQPAQGPTQPPVEPSFGDSSASRAGFVPNGGGMAPGLGGYCPVELVETQLWASGDARWACIHRGRVYHMSGQAQRERFMANPDRYAPVLAGTDAVLALEENASVAGRTEFCVDYDGRLYMFSSAATMASFHRNPVRYAGFVAQTTR